MDNKGLAQFKTSEKASSTPLLKDLYQHVTPQYAADWKVIGTLLGLPSGELKIIEGGYPTNLKWCCNQMLEKWLETDPTASWGRLIMIIESPAVSNDQPDKATTKLDIHTCDSGSMAIDQGVSILSNMVSQMNVQARFMIGNTWPQDQPKIFIPLLLVYYEGHRNLQQAMAITKLTQKGDIASLATNQPVPKSHPSYQPLQEVIDTSTVTKEIDQILALLENKKEPQFILIEGPPGIGKSVLLKEIAYRWGENRILKYFKFVLFVHLRNPTVQQTTSVHDLLQVFCVGHKGAQEITLTCGDYLIKNGGKDLFLLDGFDELPVAFREVGLITSILERRVLPKCGLIVSSRPYASENLRKQATLRVDILGFTEIERMDFIKQALPHAVKELTDYLECNLTINGLCFIPFNMVILIYLYKQGIPLPSNSMQLYNYFICLTICRHLAKSGQPLDNTIIDLVSLPEPCNMIIQQLSVLSLEGLNSNKLIFTLEEMQAACPNIAAIPGAISGFGLLQTIQHFGLTGKTMTFNFIHFSIQEFLAAYRITYLPPDKELQVLRETFWSKIHRNMFSLYISLTKGQRPAFKQFISGENGATTISEVFLKNQLKSLHLFRSFYEVGDKAFYTSIQNGESFNKNTIDLCTILSPYDIECVTLFLVCSPHKKWEKLDLRGCHIQDHGLRILHRNLFRSNITIKELGLSVNYLTSSSSALISDLTIHCTVEVLRISGNLTIGEDLALYDILSHPSSMLVKLRMLVTSLSSSSAIALFTALAKRDKLQQLYLGDNDIADEACDTIATTLSTNTTLVKLGMRLNKISAEAAQHLVQSLSHNDTLEVLELDHYPSEVEKKIKSLQEKVIKNREGRGCQTKLNIYD